MEVLCGEACVQPTSAGPQSSELLAVLAAREFSNAKKKCSGLQGGGCSLLKCAGGSQPWCCGMAGFACFQTCKTPEALKYFNEVV